jgi:hypothetical protein
MSRGPGHPRKVTKVDRRTMRAARRALLDVAAELRLPRGSYPSSERSSRLAVQPRPLALAVLAVKLAQALELIAADEVERARELDGVTWEQVGEAFGVSMQSAHARFRRRS